jgi:predicted  nucleic acid-binding Zn-ribbon protein
MANKKTHRPADERLQEALAQVARLQAKVHADAINSNPTIQDKYDSFLIRANLWKEKGANAEADIKSLDALLNDLQNQRNGAVSEISSAIAG